MALPRRRSAARLVIFRNRVTELLGVDIPSASCGPGRPSAILELHHDGDLDASLPQCGAVAGRIEEVLPAARIIELTVSELEATLARLTDRYPVGAPIR